jgi:hypothetical protein
MPPQPNGFSGKPGELPAILAHESSMWTVTRRIGKSLANSSRVVSWAADAGIGLHLTSITSWSRIIVPSNGEFEPARASDR